MPIANGFLLPGQFASEYFFELKVAHCPACGMVQLTEHVDREKMFHENYAFYSSTSKRMAEHFQRLAEDVRGRYLMGKDPFVVEIGSNDGITLQHFARAGVRHLGIEPSADAFLGANVMCHIPYRHSVAEGIRLLLKPGGVLVYEDPYLGDIVEKTSYDQIYDEHAFYFSVASVGHLFGEHGMEVVDVAAQHVHGGSMRYVIAHKGSRPVSQAVERQRAKEKALGLHLASTYTQVSRNIERSRDELMKLLRELKRQGKRVVGYGATSKSTTVTNYCGIKPDLVEFISDTTPIKQGKFSPGVHIPVRPYAEFASRYPDYALLFAWNHGEEIMAKEGAFVAAGGKWISYVPKVAVL
jgi:methylation protein EvaC